MTLQRGAGFALPEVFSRDFLLHHRLCPIGRRDDGTVVVATGAAPLRGALKEVATAFGAGVTTEQVPDDDLDRVIERLTTRANREIELTRLESESDELTSDVRDLANQPPVIRFVNLLLRDAYDAGASDIHLEATRAGLPSASAWTEN